MRRNNLKIGSILFIIMYFFLQNQCSVNEEILKCCLSRPVSLPWFFIFSLIGKFIDHFWWFFSRWLEIHFPNRYVAKKNIFTYVPSCYLLSKHISGKKPWKIRKFRIETKFNIICFHIFDEFFSDVNAKLLQCTDM